MSAEIKQMEKELYDYIDDYKKKEDRLHYGNMAISVFYLIVLFLFGLPIWYRTTTPERWSLPDISSLMVRSQTLAHYYRISIVCLDETEVFDKNHLRQQLQSNYLKRISFDQSLSFVHDWNVRSALNNEISHFMSVNQNASNFLDQIDKKLSIDKIQLQNSIIFYILPKNIRTDQLINTGRYRSYFIDLNHVDQCPQDDDLVNCLADKIYKTVQNVQFLVERFYSHQSGDQEQNIDLLMARDFDFLFDIIYEEDETNSNVDLDERKSRHNTWVSIIDDLIKQFYTHRFSFSRYFRINFISQVLHYVFPNENFVSSKLLKNVPDSERLLPLSSVESILNRIESSRVEHDNEKSYHLVLYVTSSSLAPLKFYNEQNKTKSNLITTPFRGSMLILNQKDDLFFGFQKFIRSFFRLARPIQFKDEFFTQLELESVVHALVQKHILETLNSLESIEKLLNKVSNMVIEEKIAKRIHDSLQSAMEASDLLKVNSDIIQTYELSWNAYSFSEKAFYDPSLLSLLYFPDDQKYAIYIPLFLPISIPIFHQIRFLFKCMMKYTKHKNNRV